MNRLRGRVIPDLKKLETAPFAIVVLFYRGWSEARSIEGRQERIRVEGPLGEARLGGLSERCEAFWESLRLFDIEDA